MEGPHYRLALVGRYSHEGKRKFFTLTIQQVLQGVILVSALLHSSYSLTLFNSKIHPTFSSFLSFFFLYLECYHSLQSAIFSHLNKLLLTPPPPLSTQESETYYRKGNKIMPYSSLKERETLSVSLGPLYHNILVLVYITV